MQLYWSDWVGSGVTWKDAFRPTVGDLITAAGGTYACVDLRTIANQNQAAGRCFVGSDTVVSPVLPARFLLDTDTDLDTALPTAVRTFINTQLGITIPLGLTWRTMFRRLMTVDGAGRWGTIVGAMRLHFGDAGAFDI